MSAFCHWGGAHAVQSYHTSRISQFNEMKSRAAFLLDPASASRGVLLYT